MCRAGSRRFGIRAAIFFGIATFLLTSSAHAQQTPETNVLQTPRMLGFTPPAPLPAVAAPPQIDPESLIRIPVTVLDDAGRCVESLEQRRQRERPQPAARLAQERPAFEMGNGAHGLTLAAALRWEV